MKSRFLILLTWIIVGCTSTPPTPPRSHTALQDEAAHPAFSETVVRALAYLGTPYRFGGHSPETGFDCSGFVWYVYRETLGINLPRTTASLSQVIPEAPENVVRPGDLVFFNTLKTAYSHVGIYLGQGRFVHAPASGGVVRIENLRTPYWQSRFNGVRRLHLATLPRQFGHSGEY